MNCQHCSAQITPAVVDDDGTVILWDDRNGITVCKKLNAGETYLFHKPMPDVAAVTS